MKRCRQDPLYREREREKDRMRRNFVRHHNPAQRQRERERDRCAKRFGRTTRACIEDIVGTVEVKIEIMDGTIETDQLLK